MPTAKRAVQVLTLLACSGAAALFFQFWRQIPGFSFVHHAFVFKPAEWLVLASMILVVLAALWAVSGRMLAAAAGISFQSALGLDTGTYLPVLLLLLAPLALVHYLDRDDMGQRMALFAVAALGVVLYLKVVRARLLVREASPSWLSTAQRFFHWPLRRQLSVLFVAAVLVFNAGSVAVFLNGVTFGGDEPHYLMIAESLVKDGDVDLANNYAARDYEHFLQPGAVLTPHVQPGRTPGSLYSFHSPGTPAVLLPFYAAARPFGRTAIILIVRFGLTLFGALLGLQMYLYARREFGNDRVALLAWFAFSFTAPVFFYSFHVFPEIFVSLISFTAYRVFRFSDRIGKPMLAVLGVLIASFVWFHALKYFFILGPLFLYGSWVVARRHRAPRDLVWLLGPGAVNLALYFVFQYSTYGSLNPTAVSWQGAMDGKQTAGAVKMWLTGIPLRFRVETLLGYFLDQRDGLLFTAPVYFLAFLGLVEIARRRMKDLWLLFFITAPYVLVSAALTQRAGYAPPSRPLVAVIWVPGILAAYFLAYNAKKLFTFVKHLAIGLSLIFVVIFCLNPFALYMETTAGIGDRGGMLFYLLSNLHFSLPKMLPSFIKVPDWQWWPNFVWPVLILLFMAAYRYAGPGNVRMRFGHYQAAAASGLVLFFAWFVFFPRVFFAREIQVPLSPTGTLTFYGLSRVSVGGNDGRFALLQDNRNYHFYFATPARIDRLRVDYGSTAGRYRLAFGFFDAPVFDQTTDGTVETVTIQEPPCYLWKGKYLYRANIRLDRMSNVSTGLRPYVFGIRPVG